MVSKLSHKQFGDSYRKEDFRSKEHDSRNDADRVYAQLTGDYPKHALNWVHDVTWSGPRKIPLKKIDFDNEQFWKASREPGKVEKFREMIRNDEDMKPILVIKRPGMKTDMVPDGHHRALAYQEEGVNPVGYIGKAKQVEGPWDYLHDSQFKDTGKDKSLYR